MALENKLERQGWRTYDKNATDKNFMSENHTKLIMFGDVSVGKTSIVRAFTSKAFDPDIASTLGVANSSFSMTFDGEEHIFNLWDTAGQESYRSITATYARNAGGAIVVFDITNRKSFENLPTWIKILNENDVRFIVVGNKCDLEDQRDVTRQEGDEFAGNNYSEYYEASAKTKMGIEEAFYSITKIASSHSNAVSIAKARSEDTENTIHLTPQNEIGQNKRRNKNQCCS